MKVTVVKEEKLSKEYKVVIPANDLNAKMEARLLQEAGNLSLPGFRKGKVPMKILKDRFGRMVMGEVLETTVNESNLKLYKDKDIKPALQPEIEIDQDFDFGKDLSYTIKIETIPSIDVMDITKLKLTREKAEPSDKEVDDALGRIAKQRKASEPIKDDRATKKGDTVIIDFDGESNGKKHSGMAATDYSLELGSNSFVPGFEDQLIGKKKGDDVEVNVTFPEGYPMKELAGQDALFKVKVKEIRETKSPEINDEFASTLGFEKLEDLKKALMEQAQKEYDMHSRQKVKKELLDILDENHKFDIPEKMADMEFQSIAHQMMGDHNHDDHGHDHDHAKNLTKEQEKEYRDIADRRVRLGIVLAEIGNKQKVQISNEELQQAVVNEAKKYPGQEAQVFDYFKNNPQALEGLKAPIYEEKVVDYILENASVTDKKVSVEDLLKDDEAEAEAKKAKKKASGSAKGAMGGASEEKKKPAAKKKTATKK